MTGSNILQGDCVYLKSGYFHVIYEMGGHYLDMKLLYFSFVMTYGFPPIGLMGFMVLGQRRCQLEFKKSS